jgi:hypothetical protein
MRRVKPLCLGTSVWAAGDVPLTANAGKTVTCAWPRDLRAAPRLPYTCVPVLDIRISFILIARR